MTEADQAIRDQAERAVLGAMLLSEQAVEDVAGLLRAVDFYRPIHATIYGEILAVWGAEKPVSALSVASALAESGELGRIGGAPYLHTLISAVPTAANAGYYAGEVAKHAHHRRRVEAAEAVQQALKIPDPDAREAKLALALADLNALTTGTPGASEPDSWAPIDLGPYLRGEVKRPEPTIGLARRDGLRLIYPGKEHCVIGEMEAGKSWILLACAAAEIQAGRHVVYVHFEEGDPADSVERLQALGVPDQAIDKLFVFVGPHQPVTDARIARLVALEPSLVILDGVNEAMSLHGQAVREEDGAAEFRRRLVKPFTGAGAAVIQADHVVKDGERRGRYALGSVHKGNAINGALILLENTEPFGRTQRGASRVYVTKDRPGHLRQHGKPTKTTGKTYLGQLVVDDTRTWVNYLDLAFLEPADDKPAEEPESTQKAVARVMAKVSEVLAEHPEGLSKNSIETLTPFRAAVVRTALELLVNEGYVLRKTVRSAHVHNLIKPFTVDTESDQ